MSDPRPLPAGIERAGIVIVFYRPDPACVARANRLAGIWPCVVVDNTEQISSASELGLDERVVYLANGANLGIATALNQGIEQLIDAGCTCALLFDQDSEPSTQLLTELPRMLSVERERSPRIALVGPAYDDQRLRGVAPFIRFDYWRLQRVAPAGNEVISVDFLITSGSCLNLAVWHEVGRMDDALFIDFVDLEWCVRAKSKGYLIFGAPTLRLSHELGGEPLRILGRNYPMHGSVRHYYAFRNAIALLMRDYVPWTWKSTELIKLPVRLMIYALFMQPRCEHVRLSVLGMWHGLTGRMGPLSRSRR